MKLLGYEGNFAEDHIKALTSGMSYDDYIREQFAK